MNTAFELNRNTALMNFTIEYCQTSIELLESEGFQKVLDAYVQRQETRDTPIYRYLIAIGKSKERVVFDVTQLSKLLLVMQTKDIESLDKEYSQYLMDTAVYLEFVERFYNYWRRLERYAIAYNRRAQSGIQNQQFIETHNRFETLVLETYRSITHALKGQKNRVYRQLIAGVNAGLIVNGVPLQVAQIYPQLKDVATIESVILHPPFITYPKRNTRTGSFKEVFEHPFTNVDINSESYLCFPLYVGDLLAFVYFHKDFIVHGVTLANLFELADFATIQTEKPDIIYVYGLEDDKDQTVFYKDAHNELYIGAVSYGEAYDYFGYMKKMILTLHNVASLDRGALPLHGAMVHLVLKDDSVKNVVIIGDSGAGKSETIEAMRSIETDEIKDIHIIFDDMGILQFENDQIVASGTEIGAFVRLDDLDTGYAYKEIDRAIFMNPHLINSRLVMPVATYEEITQRYPVDLFLYANNYTDDLPIYFFQTMEEAKQTFLSGRRMAKGTTSENGIVDSYFANPFGPLQRQEQTDQLIEYYFKKMADTHVKIGEIRTKLGFSESVHQGPKDAAKSLIAYLLE